jgi:hypothetical protein
MELSDLSVFHPWDGIALLVSAIPLRRSLIGLEVFPFPGLAFQCFKPRSHSTRRLTLSFRVSPDPTATGRAGSVLSWGFCPFSVLRAPEARFSRVYLTRHLPSSGFRTLMTVCFLRSPPAMFQTRNAHGVFPSGLFPPAEPSKPFGFDPLPGVGLAHRNRFDTTHWHRASPSRLYSLQGFDTETDGMSHRQTAAALLVFSPSREFLPVAAHSLRCGSPHGLHSSHMLQNRGPRAMEAMSLQGLDINRTGLSLTRLPPLLGFAHLLSKRPV